MAKTTAGQMRAWRGPALFSFGFRPFFFFGASWAVVAMLLWIPALTGAIDLPTRFDPVSWHAHEFLFGYLGAVLAGFLLTAVPNWTGRLPIVGLPLAALFLLWLAGRVSVLFSGEMPGGLAATVDLAFPLVLGMVILREIVAGKNWRNLVVLALLGLFATGNALFHIENAQAGYAAQGYGFRLGLATAVLMIAVIGGRIIPSFTRNWLARTENPARPAPPMQRFDKVVLAASVVILLLWAAWPSGLLTGAALLGMGVLHSVRLARWSGHHTLKEPLVWILHVAYAFVPLGAFAMGLALLSGAEGTAAVQHLWTSGAIGAMTLAVMSRATLGHTGQSLTANTAAVAVYLCHIGAVVARMFVPIHPAMAEVSGLFWLLAFGGFVLVYGPLLLRSRPG